MPETVQSTDPEYTVFSYIYTPTISLIYKLSTVKRSTITNNKKTIKIVIKVM